MKTVYESMCGIAHQETVDQTTIARVLEECLGTEGYQYHLIVESEGKAGVVVNIFTNKEEAFLAMNALVVDEDRLKEVMKDAAKKPPTPKEADVSSFIGILRESARRAVDKACPRGRRDWIGSGIIGGAGLVIGGATVWGVTLALQRSIRSGGATADVLRVPLAWLGGSAANMICVSLIAKRLNH